MILDLVLDFFHLFINDSKITSRAQSSIPHRAQHRIEDSREETQHDRMQTPKGLSSSEQQSAF